MRGAAWIVLACAAALVVGAEERGEWRIVACSAAGRCEAMPDQSPLRLPRDAEWAWIWTSQSVPRRVPSQELHRAMSTVAESAEVAELRLRPSPPLSGEMRFVIAAPLDMWTEVPEPLLPRYPCAETVSIPVQAGGPSRIRVVSRGMERSR